MLHRLFTLLRTYALRTFSNFDATVIRKSDYIMFLEQ